MVSRARAQGIAFLGLVATFRAYLSHILVQGAYSVHYHRFCNSKPLAHNISIAHHIMSNLPTNRPSFYHGPRGSFERAKCLDVRRQRPYCSAWWPASYKWRHECQLLLYGRNHSLVHD